MRGQYRRCLVRWARRVVNPRSQYPHLRVPEACRRGPLLHLRMAACQSRLRTLLTRLGRTRRLARDPSSYSQRLRRTSFLRGSSYLLANRHHLGANTLHLLHVATWLPRRRLTLILTGLRHRLQAPVFPSRHPRKRVKYCLPLDLTAVVLRRCSNRRTLD